MRVRDIVVTRILARRQHAAQRVPFIHGPRDDEGVRARQRLGAAGRRLRGRGRREALGPGNVDEAAEPGRLREGKEGGAFRTLGVEIDDVALNIVETGVPLSRGAHRVSRWRNGNGREINTDVALDPGAVDNHKPLPKWTERTASSPGSRRSRLSGL